MVERDRRLAMNEALFRQVNERLEGLNEAFETPTDDFEIVCECSDLACLEQIRIPVDAYERMRADPTSFAVVPGHSRREIEAVIEGHETWHLVQKRRPDAARVADRTSPRTDSD